MNSGERNGRSGDRGDGSRPCGGSLATADPGSEPSWPIPAPSAPTDPRVAAALAEYLAALEAGSPLSREEFLDRHASIAGALAECLSGLEFVNTVGRQFDESTSPDGPDGAGDLAISAARLGEYRLFREVGRGSMGVVYEAEQVSLGRRVALKVLPFASALDPRQRQRFLIEAQAAAQLHHPHIVPVFAAGCDRGVHFYAMQFVDGRSLAEWVGDSRRQIGVVKPRPGVDDSGLAGDEAHAVSLTPTVTLPVDPAGFEAESSRMSQVRDGGWSEKAPRPDFRAIARLGIQAAEALDHAHSLGVLHRDIKPANLLVDSKGDLWITDFGLARFRGDTSLTRSGDLVGTLRYMSPEQALARRGVVDQRTDIYALALTLYELMTLRPAFDGREHHELLRQIAMDEPVPPRRIDPTIPRDLETIIMKAACKEPSGRYTTAQELADDLLRFYGDRPILARRPTILERGVRWARRHKQIVVTAATVLLLALVLGTAAVGMQARKTEAMWRKLLSYIQNSFRAVDAITITAMEQATRTAMGAGQGDERMQMLDVYNKALGFYEQAAKLPPTDLASRTIVARAHYRMGFTHAVMSGAYMTDEGPHPKHLAQAEEHYRDAISRFERLLAESPRDPDVRQQFADALGEWGLGWYMATTKRPEQSEPHYRRALELRRDLVLDPRVGASILSEELPRLARLAHLLAGHLEARKDREGAERVRRELAEVCTSLAGRPLGPETRREIGAPLGAYGVQLTGQDRRRDGVEVLRLATLLDPENPVLQNNMAWFLASVADTPPHDPSVALRAARKAVSLDAKNWMFWNTLGVAEYRAGDWEAAEKDLEKSMSLNHGGEAADWYFMAMTRWRQGRPDEARRWFDRAAAWTREKQPRNPELRRFRAEAEGLLGLAKEKESPGPGQTVEK